MRTKDEVFFSLQQLKSRFPVHAEFIDARAAIYNQDYPEHRKISEIYSEVRNLIEKRKTLNRALRGIPGKRGIGSQRGARRR